MFNSVLFVYAINLVTKRLVFRTFVAGKSQLCKAIILQQRSFKITKLTLTKNNYLENIRFHNSDC